MTTILTKYPRTPHLPWSEGRSEDDVSQKTTRVFDGRMVVVTEKMDGENTSLYRDHIHARSLDSGNHPSRSWVKQLHGQIAKDIPEGWRVCGENLYAQHSIFYRDLSSYFMVFSIWNEKNEALSWDDTVQYAGLLGLITVPVLYRGPWNEKAVRALYNPLEHLDNREGYVVRVEDSFPYKDFAKSMAKFVRKNHVQTDEHWMMKPVVPNQLVSIDDQE